MVSVPDKHKQTIGDFRPILWVSANVGALFERSEFAETFANRRRSKMGEIDVSVVLGWHGHRLQIVALNCAIWQVLKKIQAFDTLITIGKLSNVCARICLEDVLRTKFGAAKRASTLGKCNVAERACTLCSKKYQPTTLFFSPSRLYFSSSFDKIRDNERQLFRIAETA